MGSVIDCLAFSNLPLLNDFGNQGVKDNENDVDGAIFNVYFIKIFNGTKISESNICIVLV